MGEQLIGYSRTDIYKVLHSYRAGVVAGWGLDGWRDMILELVNCRELIWRLFMRDFIARYRQSALGVLWALIMPLAMTGTFVFLNRTGVFNVGEIQVPYPIYALLGLTIWQVFAGGLVTCSNAIVAGGSIVVKISFPKEALVIAAMGQTIVETAVRLGLLILAFIFYGVTPAWTCLLFPFALAPIFLLTLGMGLILSLFNALLRDIANMVTLGTSLLIFLTPVLYPAAAMNAFSDFIYYNPLTPLVTGARDLVLTGYLTDPRGFLGGTVFAAVVFLVCWRVFHISEMRMAERVGAL